MLSMPFRVTSLKSSVPRVFACHFSSDAEKTSAASAATEEEVEEPEAVKPTVKPGNSSVHEFQAETTQLLEIVAKSLYTDREVFVRELISNAADALEKVRHLTSTGTTIEDAEKDLQIFIDLDKDAQTITISDTGIGLTKDELHKCLGTIARSGSKQFVKEATGSSTDAAHSIIGQFGVGFYSAFMVADNVSVFTKSALPGSESLVWTSKGVGKYDINEAENVSRGTSVVIKLREDAKEFADKANVRDIIKKYSNFVNFPIILDGDKVNTLKAIWTLNKNEIAEEEYTEFYRFIANAYDEPMFRLHFSADAPIALNALLFVGTQHLEKFGQGRMEKNHSLYSRKVLITNKADTLMPDFLRFVHMVIDSEDIPLNVSRENMQDSNLMNRISKVLTTRILRFFEEKARREPEKYLEFFNEFGPFLQEGAVSHPEHKNQLAKLLRFESSALEAGEKTSLDEYMARGKVEDGKIYYLSSANRKLALASPYYEVFKKKKKEVLFLYSPLDDLALSNIETYNGKSITSAESEDVKDITDATDDDSKDETEALSKEEEDSVVDYIKSVLGDRVKSVKTTTRLVDSPAVATGHGSSSVQQMMKAIGKQHGVTEAMMQTTKPHLEVNASHPIIVGLNTYRHTNPPVADQLTEQLLDNALVSAGILDDPRQMLGRINDLLSVIVASPTSADAAATEGVELEESSVTIEDKK